jgi:hypothetical protein
MALRDVAVNLMMMQSMRGASITRLMRESVKQNVMARFSVLGMAATLTRSQTLKQIALMRYANKVDQERQMKSDMAIEAQNEKFKSYVTGSIKTLSNQVTILTAVSEKNTALINTIMSDLGYFKGQRKFNVLTQSGKITAPRAPLSSRSVKGRIEAINKEIEMLKSMKAPADPYYVDPRIKEAKERREKENEKLKKMVKSIVAVSLAGAGLTAVGAGVMGGNKLLAAGGAAATAAGAISAEVTRKVIKSAIPILGKAFTVGLLIEPAKSLAGRIGRRMEGGVGFELEDKDQYKNKEIVGTQEYYLRQQQIEFKKSVNYLIETPLKEIDEVLAGLVAYTAISSAGKFAVFAGRNRYLRKLLPKVLGSIPGGGALASQVRLPPLAATAVRPEAVPAAAAPGASMTGIANNATLSGTIIGGRVWDAKRKMWITPVFDPISQRFKDPISGKFVKSPKGQTPIGAAPKATTTGSTYKFTQRVVPLKVTKALIQLELFVKRNRFMGYTKTAAVGGLLLVPAIISMSTAIEQYKNGVISPTQYKETMISGINTFVQTIGVSGLAAAVGGVFGGPAGFFAGLGGGTIASLFLNDESMAVSEKIFGWMSGIVLPPEPTQEELSKEFDPFATNYNLTKEQIATISARTTDKERVNKVLGEDSAFASEVMRVSEKFMIDPADLLKVMYKESAIDPKAENNVTGATGLIQFMPITAADLGVPGAIGKPKDKGGSTGVLGSLSAAEQMKWVEKYFDKWGLPVGSDLGTIYAYVLQPAAAQKGSNVLISSGTKAYELNDKLDLDGDGNITVDELAARANDVKVQPSMFADAFGQTADFNRSYIEKALGVMSTLPRESTVMSKQEESIALGEDSVSQLNVDNAQKTALAALMVGQNIDKRVNFLTRQVIELRENQINQIEKPSASDPTLAYG